MRKKLKLSFDGGHSDSKYANKAMVEWRPTITKSNVKNDFVVLFTLNRKNIHFITRKDTSVNKLNVQKIYEKHPSFQQTRVFSMKMLKTEALSNARNNMEYRFILPVR
jgi:hypothetical protein